MNCKPFLRDCKGMCCSCCPIPRDLFKFHIDKIVREPTFVKVAPPYKGQEQVIPVTADAKCVFLREDYTCNIYKDRPMICRMFGSETSLFLSCLYQRSDGSPRLERDRKRLMNKIQKKYAKLRNKILKYKALCDEDYIV